VLHITANQGNPSRVQATDTAGVSATNTLLHFAAITVVGVAIVVLTYLLIVS
jgi:hypothetical protein